MTTVPPSGGVRSLLAKFENNSQNTSTSPPSRGRSPTNANDSPNARPLSKVRASFVPVDRVGRGSPAGFPRVKDGEGSEKDPRLRTMTPVESLNSPSYSSSQTVRGEPASLQGTTVGQINERLEALAVSAGSQSARAAFEARETPLVAAKKESQAKAPSPEANGVKGSTATKSTPQDSKPGANCSSPVSTAKGNPAAKSNPKPSSTKEQKSTSATSRTSATSASKQTAADEKASAKKAMTTRQSTALNTKPAATPPPAATRNPRSLPASPRVRSPGRSSRNPASSTAPTLASVAKSNTPPPTLSRKSSSLKPGVSSRLTAPTASSLRKQPSRQSLPAQSTQERPKSRVSTTSTTRTAADESFLARMMRPTASSASKAHAKVEPKSPPKTTKTVKPARKSGEGVAEKRPVRPSSKTSQRESSAKPRSKTKPESERLSAGTPSVENQASDKAQSEATEPAPETVDSTLETKSEASQARSEESVAATGPTKQNEDHESEPADVSGDNVEANKPSTEVAGETPLQPTEQPQQDPESRGEEATASPDAPKDEAQSANAPSVGESDEKANEAVASDANTTSEPPTGSLAEPASTDDGLQPAPDKAETS